MSRAEQIGARHQAAGEASRANAALSTRYGTVVAAVSDGATAAAAASAAPATNGRAIAGASASTRDFQPAQHQRPASACRECRGGGSPNEGPGSRGFEEGTHVWWTASGSEQQGGRRRSNVAAASPERAAPSKWVGPPELWGLAGGRMGLCERRALWPRGPSLLAAWLRSMGSSSTFLGSVWYCRVRRGSLATRSQAGVWGGRRGCREEGCSARTRRGVARARGGKGASSRRWHALPRPGTDLGVLRYPHSAAMAMAVGSRPPSARMAA